MHDYSETHCAQAGLRDGAASYQDMRLKRRCSGQFASQAQMQTSRAIEAASS